MDSLLDSRFTDIVTEIVDFNLTKDDLEKIKELKGYTTSKCHITKIKNSSGQNGFKISFYKDTDVKRVSLTSRLYCWNKLWSRVCYFIKAVKQCELENIFDDNNVERLVSRRKSIFEMERADQSLSEKLTTYLYNKVTIGKIILENCKDGSIAHKIIMTNADKLYVTTLILTPEENFKRIVNVLNKVEYPDRDILIEAYNNKVEKIKSSTEFQIGYLVNEDGNVYSKKRGMCKKIEGDHSGYKAVRPYDENGKRKQKLIHRVVAEEFCEKKDGMNIVNHLDGNKQNNRPENLEWTDADGNMQHASDNGLLKKKNPKEGDKGYDLYLESREWKQVTNFLDYRISRDGRCYSDKIWNLLEYNKKEARLSVWLDKNSKCFIDKLVAREYIDNSNNCKYVGYKDKDANNCNVNNLYWTNKRIQKVKPVVLKENNNYEKYKPWRTLEETPFIQYSLHGKIWSDREKRILELTKTTSGYLDCDFKYPDKRVRSLAHVLIAKAWDDTIEHDYPKDFPFQETEIDHKNRVRDDNRVENLRRTTSTKNSGNADHKHLVKIIVYKDDIEIHKFKTIKEASEEMQKRYNDKFVTSCISEKSRSGKLYKGFKFVREN
jgi:hypothetical protein